MRIALAMLVVSGCSWALVEPPLRYDSGARPLTCTTAWAPPIADTVLATALVGGATASVIADLSPAVLIATALAAIPYGVSAWYGYPRVDRCRRLNAQKRPL